MDQQHQSPVEDDSALGCSTGCLASILGGVVGLLAGVLGAYYTVGKMVEFAFVLIPPITGAIGAIAGYIVGVLWKAWR